jgi:arylsulfatase A
MKPLFLLCLLGTLCFAWATEKPNVVIIFIDDMGYGDIGPFGSDQPNPNLDRMAKEGMKLTGFYVSSDACAPSRSALMTGCYADRIGMGKSVVFLADKRGLNPKEITVAEILKKGGRGNETTSRANTLKKSGN